MRPTYGERRASDAHRVRNPSSRTNPRRAPVDVTRPPARACTILDGHGDAIGGEMSIEDALAMVPRVTSRVRVVDADTGRELAWRAANTGRVGREDDGEEREAAE